MSRSNHGAPHPGCSAPRRIATRTVDIYLREGKPDKTILTICGCWSGDCKPNCATCLLLLGIAYFHKRIYKKAEEYFKSVIVHTSATSEQVKNAEKWSDEAVTRRLTGPLSSTGFKHAAVIQKTKDDMSSEYVRKTPAMVPSPPHPDRLESVVERFRVALINIIGSVSRNLFDIAKWLNHWLFGGYKERDTPWTNWYSRQGLFANIRGLLHLAKMRDDLYKENLVDTYPVTELVGGEPFGAHAPDGAVNFRTADGSWNNLDDPREGAAGTRFSRNSARESSHCELDPDSSTPDPRLISRELLRRDGQKNPTDQQIPFLNMLSVAWIQFMVHGWVDHSVDETRKRYVIKLDPKDPLNERRFVGALHARRTIFDQPPTENNRFATALNTVTHWWDGSQVYGSDELTQRRLRRFKYGHLRLIERKEQHSDRSPRYLLPLENDSGIDDTGFNRNWWLGLSLMHTLFAQEHNAICERLRQVHPSWDDDRLFNVARLINAAVMAKIHTIEWTPAILPNPILNTAMYSNWYGVWDYKVHKRKFRDTKSKSNIEHPEMGGLVGNPIDKHDKRFAFSEEFVEIYRLHSLFPEKIDLYRHRSRQQYATLPTSETRERGARLLMETQPTEDLFYSLGRQKPYKLELHNYPEFMQAMATQDDAWFDLAAVDILRARERGVPRYNEFRRQLQLTPISSFNDLVRIEWFKNKPGEGEAYQRKLRGMLRKVYNAGDKDSEPDSVEDLDLLVGTLAEHESVRPTGFGFGETLFQVFILNASRRLQTDRFFTDFYNAATFTLEGLRWIDDADFKSVLLRHYPELASTHLKHIKNAFEPWEKIHDIEKSHPLRVFDPDLRDNQRRCSDKERYVEDVGNTRVFCVERFRKF